MQVTLNTINNVVLVSDWYLLLLLLLNTIQISIKRNLHFYSISIEYRYLTMFLFSMPFGSIYHVRIIVPRKQCSSIAMV